MLAMATNGHHCMKDQSIRAVPSRPKRSVQSACIVDVDKWAGSIYKRDLAMCEVEEEEAKSVPHSPLQLASSAHLTGTVTTSSYRLAVLRACSGLERHMPEPEPIKERYPTASTPKSIIALRCSQVLSSQPAQPIRSACSPIVNKFGSGIYDLETEEHVHEEEMEVERTEEEEHVEKDLHSTGRGKRQLPPEVASRPQSSKKLCATSDQYAGCVYERAEELFVHGDDTGAVEESAGLTKATHGAEAEELSVAESAQDHSRAGGGIQEEKNLGSDEELMVFMPPGMKPWCTGGHWCIAGHWCSCDPLCKGGH